MRICLVPRLSGVGGMVSFEHKLAAGLSARSVEVSYDIDDHNCEAILVIGGTRYLAALKKARQRGVRVVQRLDGMNWLHRLQRRERANWTGLRHFFRAEYGNFILALIRSRLAQHVIYQSDFARRWWERVRGATPVPESVIYNGVDLRFYTPQGSYQHPEERYRLLLVEGSLMGGYEQGLRVALQLAQRLSAMYRHGLDKKIELMIVGRVPSDLRKRWQDSLSSDLLSGKLSLIWEGLVEPQRIPEIDRSAHLLYSADVNAACPNSVIEALACGLPVISFNTGALPELVKNGAGRIVPYGGDPWQLEPPDVNGLTQAAIEVMNQQDDFRAAARALAEAEFGLDKMVDAYLGVLLNN